MELDRRLRRDLRQLLGRERIERRALRQEASDLAQPGVQFGLPPRTISIPKP
ncbi:MAG: hypothetical protein ABSH51_18005 [Solirubrobacteraceae bacterium]